MKPIQELIHQFKETLIERGHSDNIVWLQESQMAPTNNGLYINVAHGFPYQFHIESTYNKLKKELESGATLMLVAADENTSYCTLLLDTFGSNHDIEIKENEFYLWCDPYAKKFELVTSKWKWFCLKNFKQRPLSSLDYAFSLEQAF